MNAPMPDHDAGVYVAPAPAESKIEARAAKVIADAICSDRYGADSTEFVGERMDICDELSVEIVDRLADRGLVIVYMPDIDKHRDEVAS